MLENGLRNVKLIRFLNDICMRDIIVVSLSYSIKLRNIFININAFEEFSKFYKLNIGTFTLMYLRKIILIL